MSSETLQYYEQERRRREAKEYVEAHHRMPDGKLIATVQICYNCNRQFVYRRRRTHCPCCQHQLRTKTMIIRP
jgi:rubrerythrin